MAKKKSDERLSKVVEEAVQPETAAETVLRAVSELGPVTSPEVSEHVRMPVSQVSSALSRMFKRIPDVLGKDSSVRPFRWEMLMEMSPDEAYQLYLKRMKPLTDLGEAPSEGLQLPIPGTGHEPVADADVRVTVTGTINIAIGWAGKL